MKNTLLLSLSLLVLMPGGAYAGDGSLTTLTGSASFSTDERTYLGTYTSTNKSISVNIDGVNYKGYYASLAEDTTGSSSGAQVGRWGRAFLFASSASTLRCQLDTGLPKVTGKCQDAGGRNFRLTPGAAQQTIVAR